MRPRNVGFGKDDKDMKRVFWLLTAGLLILMVELAGLGLAALEQHRLIYLAPERPPVVQQSVIMQVHPYFGFIYSPTSPDFEARERGVLYRDGFTTDVKYAARYAELLSYPIRRRNDKVLLVGIFGGSLANAVAFLEQRNGWLSRSLTEIPAYAGREPIILNFALPAHKQPQPNQVLAYFVAVGQPFDIVINIDGFNEKGSLWVQSNLDPTFPDTNAWRVLREMLDHPESAESSKARVRRLYHEAGIQLAAPGECRFGICYVAARLVESYHRIMVAHHDQGATPLSHFSWPPPHPGNAYDNAVDVWVTSSLSMAQMSKGIGATYLHVLHPNQWFRKRNDFKPDSPEAAASGVEAKIIYPLLTKAGADRLSPRINFFDATGILDDRLDVYGDDCCHLNQTGSQLLAEAIGSELKRIAKRRAPRSP